jgi:cytochrome c
MKTPRSTGGRLLLAAVLGVVALTLPACRQAEQAETVLAPGCDLTRGGRVFAKCQICHSAEAGGPHIVGPNLYAVLGRRAGTAQGYMYSEAFRGADFIWSREKLDQYLEDPGKFVERNWMPFTGLKNPEDREAVICYLEGS